MNEDPDLEEMETDVGEDNRVPVTGHKWVLGIATAVFVGWAGWVSLMLISVDRRLLLEEERVNKVDILERRISIIEGNRYTSGMALQHANEDRQMQQDLNTHTRLAGHPVVLERVAAIRVQLDRMEKKIDKLK